MLVRAGADTQILNDAGDTPAEMLEKSQHWMRKGFNGDYELLSSQMESSLGIASTSPNLGTAATTSTE